MKARKAVTLPTNDRYAVSYAEAAQIIGTGVSTAKRLASEAGAVVYIGRSARVILPKLLAYIDGMTKQK